jgi:hypothetical protein
MQGLFFRTARMIESGLKPVFVFDGKPPALKAITLGGRGTRREDAQAALAVAKEGGDVAEIEKYSKRTIKACGQLTCWSHDLVETGPAMAVTTVVCSMRMVLYAAQLL